MAINRAALPQQLKKSVKKLNKKAPKGEFLAYINAKEAELLKKHGGSGIMTEHGIPSFWNWGTSFEDAVSTGSQHGSPASSNGSNDNDRDDYQHELSYVPEPTYTPTYTMKEVAGDETVHTEDEKREDAAELNRHFYVPTPDTAPEFGPTEKEKEEAKIIEARLSNSIYFPTPDTVPEFGPKPEIITDDGSDSVPPPVVAPTLETVAEPEGITAEQDAAAVAALDYGTTVPVQLTAAADMPYTRTGQTDLSHLIDPRMQRPYAENVQLMTAADGGRAGYNQGYLVDDDEE